MSPDSRSAFLGMARGVIGANLMQTDVWQLDLPARTLTIAEGISDLVHIDGAIGLDFRAFSSSSPSPVVDIGVGAGRLPFLVDTGSDGTLAANPIDLAGAGMTLDLAGSTDSLSVASWSGRNEAMVTPVAGQLTLGDGPPHRRVILATDALGRMGIMGTGFLGDYVLTIDWPSRRLYLDPIGRTATIDQMRVRELARRQPKPQRRVRAAAVGSGCPARPSAVGGQSGAP
jgi:hypothetical protein